MVTHHPAMCRDYRHCGSGNMFISIHDRLFGGFSQMEGGGKKGPPP